jgi:LysR family transcriptional regulator, low CO2-responsive transcriptional regulator
MRITWNQLRLFEAVARNGSFTRAAEELHVVQPTVSAQIKQLTETVGVPVFEQVGKKIYLTEAGKELQKTIRELFESWERFEMTISNLKGAKAGRLRVAIVTTAKYFIPRLLGPFCQHYPGIDVSLEIVNRDQVVDRLVENLDDLYIMGVPPEHLAIEKFPFLQNPLVVIAPKGHDLAGKKRVTLARLAHERFISREKGSGTRIATEEFFNKRKIPLSVKMELSNNEAIKWAVAGGMGLSIVSQHALMLEPMQDKIAVLDVEGFPIIRSWYIVYPTGKRLSVVAATFFEYLKEEAEMIQEELFAFKRPTERAKK